MSFATHDDLYRLREEMWRIHEASGTEEFKKLISNSNFKWIHKGNGEFEYTSTSGKSCGYTGFLSIRIFKQEVLNSLIIGNEYEIEIINGFPTTLKGVTQ